MGREKVNCWKVRTACEVKELAEMSEIQGKNISLSRQCAETFETEICGQRCPSSPKKTIYFSTTNLLSALKDSLV